MIGNKFETKEFEGIQGYETFVKNISENISENILLIEENELNIVVVDNTFIEQLYQDKTNNYFKFKNLDSLLIKPHSLLNDVTSNNIILIQGKLNKIMDIC